MMTREQNLSFKLEKLREAIAKGGYAALEINSQANFSWLTRGRGFIGLAAVAACGSLIVTPNKVYLVTENIEAERLYVEELHQTPEIEVRPFPWNQPEQRGAILAEILDGGKLATEQDLASALFGLRTVMTDYDLEDYRALCQESAQILESTVRGLTPGVSGFELAGELARGLWAAGIEPITALSAFDGRALQYRHPIPYTDRLENYALVVICGRRNGLIASVTRNILLREDPGMIEKHAKCAMVDAVATAKLQPGAVLGDIFTAMAAEYAAQGYPGEEVFHHQGGLTGFMPREIRAVASTSHTVRANEVYAFNPSLQGSKCEDTILVTESGIEVMSHTGNYAYVNCEINGTTIQKPTVLVLQ